MFNQNDINLLIQIIPNGRQATIDYIASLRNRASEITDRANNLRAIWNNVNPNNRI